jgi:acyl-CoA synthetase (AMP-forming)/AMP-acid ligase II
LLRVCGLTPFRGQPRGGTMGRMKIPEPPSADLSAGQQSVNVADRLRPIAERQPDAVAVACPGRGDVAGRNSYATCTFQELDQDATSLACGFAELGVQPGTRMVLLVRPGIEFVKLVFALLRCGATTVLVDPGMGRRHLVNCLAAAEPEGFVAISPAQAMRTVLRRRFPDARKNVTVGRRWFWGGTTYRRLLETGKHSQIALPITRAADPAAIIFTSGSTGPPKGVLYTHEMFLTQADEIRQHYGIQPGGADLACFALFGLFNSAMGVTTVFPKMDFSRPAAADPRQLLAAAHDWRVTQAFASPAVWSKLSQYCADHDERIPTLRKVFSCGAPVPADVLRRTLACVHPEAQMHTPYGATESLPVASISAREVLGETASETDRGAGVCVGRKFDSLQWRVIRISDEPIASLDDTEQLPTGEIGELIVRGPQVSPAYVTGGQRHNARAKISDGDAVWHRLGDVGYFDEQGRFWYCGRKSQRVRHRNGMLFTVPIESVFNTLPNIRRTALVGVGEAEQQEPVLIIECIRPDPLAGRGDALWKKWREIEPRIEQLWYGKSLERSNEESFTSFPAVLVHPQLPVDVRHNSKINREALAAWAAKKLNPDP